MKPRDFRLNTKALSFLGVYTRKTLVFKVSIIDVFTLVSASKVFVLPGIIIVLCKQ